MAAVGLQVFFQIVEGGGAVSKIFHVFKYFSNAVPTCSDCRKKSLHHTTPINMTFKKTWHDQSLSQMLQNSIFQQQGTAGITNNTVHSEACPPPLMLDGRHRVKRRTCPSSTFCDESLLCWRCCLYVDWAGSIFSLCLPQSNRQLSVLTNWVQVLM